MSWTVAMRGFYIPVMLLCKQQINEGLTLHAPMERACNEIAYNHRKQGASALGFAWDQCSEMGAGNLDARSSQMHQFKFSYNGGTFGSNLLYIFG